MKHIIYGVTLCVIAVLLSLYLLSSLLIVPHAEAQEVYSLVHNDTQPVQIFERFNNENWFRLPHPKPTSFTVTTQGEVFGTTTLGIPFLQINVSNEDDVRIQKFIIQDHYHYIIEGNPVYTTEELSIRLSSLNDKHKPIG